MGANSKNLNQAYAALRSASEAAQAALEDATAASERILAELRRSYTPVGIHLTPVR